jgi:hypothetical protein
MLLFGASILWLIPAGSPAVTPPAATYLCDLHETDAGGVQTGMSYTAPGSYSFNQMTGTAVGSPAVTLRAHGAATNVNNQSAALSRITYSCVVNGPQNIVVPLSISSVLHVDVNGPFNTNLASADAHIHATGVVSGNYDKDLAVDLAAGPAAADYAGTGSFSTIANHPETITVSAIGDTYAGAVANAYADPYVFIDPAWADANPGYSVTLSDGVGNSLPGAIVMIDALSRKTHGTAGTFDIHLPLTGTPGVECRGSGGNHTLVFTFTNDVATGSASVTAGAGSVVGNPVLSGKTMTVNLAGVTDVQKLTVTLSGVTDVMGHALPTTPLSVNMLIGDTNGNKTVNASDIGQIKGQSGSGVTVANFREDVTVNGTISASDIGLVKSRSGASLP